MKSYKLFCMAAAFAPMLSCAQVHKEQTLRDGWTFSFNGGEFKEVVLPHDWAISGEFDEGIDTYTTKEVRNGKEVTVLNTGTTGALPWIGKGEYRTTFKVPKQYTHAELLFDGAMAEPEVYVNGEKAGEQTGEHVFSFRVPLTGEIEVKAVAGDCTDTASFRHVDTPNPSYKLVKTKSKSANWV